MELQMFVCAVLGTLVFSASLLSVAEPLLQTSRSVLSKGISCHSFRAASAAADSKYRASNAVGERLMGSMACFLAAYGLARGAPLAHDRSHPPSTYRRDSNRRPCDRQRVRVVKR